MRKFSKIKLRVIDDILRKLLSNVLCVFTYRENTFFARQFSGCLLSNGHRKPRGRLYSFYGTNDNTFKQVADFTGENQLRVRQNLPRPPCSKTLRRTLGSCFRWNPSFPFIVRIPDPRIIKITKCTRVFFFFIHPSAYGIRSVIVVFPSSVDP